MDFQLLPLLRRYAIHCVDYKNRIVLILLFVLGIVAQRMALPFLIRDLTDFIATRSQNMSSLKTTMILLAVVLVIGLLLHLFRDILNIEFQLGGMQRLSVECFSCIHSHSIGFFQDTFTGALVKKENRYVNSFESIADRFTFFFFPFLFEFGTTMVIFWGIHWTFGVLMSVYFLVFCLLTWIGIQKKIPYDMAATRAQTAVSARLADTVGNAMTIKAFGAFDREVEAYTEITMKSKIARKRAWTFDTYMRSIQEIPQLCFTFILYGLYAYMSYQKVISASDVVLLFGLDNILKSRTWDFGNQIKHLFEDASYAMEMVEILETPYEVVDSSDAKELIINA